MDTLSQWQKLVEEWPDVNGDRKAKLSREAVRLKCTLEDIIIHLSEINALRLQFLLQLSITDIKCTKAQATSDIPALKPPPPPPADATMSSNSDTMSSAGGQRQVHMKIPKAFITSSYGDAAD